MDDAWVQGAIGAAGVVLTGAIWRLWDRSEKRSQQTERRLETKLDACEERHDVTHNQLVALTGKVGELEGLVKGRTEGIRELAEEVTRVVRDGR